MNKKKKICLIFSAFVKISMCFVFWLWILVPKTYCNSRCLKFDSSFATLFLEYLLNREIVRLIFSAIQINSTMSLINLVKFCITLCCCWTAVSSDTTVYQEISTNPDLSKVSHSIKYLIVLKVVHYFNLVFKPIVKVI